MLSNVTKGRGVGRASNGRRCQASRTRAQGDVCQRAQRLPRDVRSRPRGRRSRLSGVAASGARPRGAAVDSSKEPSLRRSSLLPLDARDQPRDRRLRLSRIAASGGRAGRRRIRRRGCLSADPTSPARFSRPPTRSTVAALEPRRAQARARGKITSRAGAPRGSAHLRVGGLACASRNRPPLRLYRFGPRAAASRVPELGLGRRARRRTGWRVSAVSFRQIVDDVTNARRGRVS